MRSLSIISVRHLVLVGALLGGLGGVTVANADSDGERAVLARLSHELSALEPLLAEAEAQATPDARIKFQYAWLRQDLQRVRAGIQDHVEVPRAEPRTVPPLKGDYRR